MAWPYHFLDLTTDEKHLRNQTLNRYATFVQLSALVPVAVQLLHLAVAWAIKISKNRRGSYDAVPSSPSLKTRRQSNLGTWDAGARKWAWWLADDVVFLGQVWGQRDLWIFGTLWAAWMLTLCVLETGHDYIHLAKRFGMVAVAQLPIQYILALKSLNPFAYIFRSSHEQVNRWHRVMGRVIALLLCLHAAFYLNFFWQNNRLHRLLARVPGLGVVAFIMMNLLNTTALGFVRSNSFRIFFITHIVVAFAVPVVLVFHTRHAIPFTVESLVVLVADLVSRKLDTVMAPATVESIPGTDLVRIVASIPHKKATKFRAYPGSHLYLQMPTRARPSSNLLSLSSLVFEFLYNPFTVADVDEQTGDLTLVVRHRTGPITSNLARLAGDGSVAKDETQVPLNIEGPYGAVKHFPRLSSGEFDRILLVAGGVGATFIVPLYRSITHDNPGTKVEMVWVMRGAKDATWAAGANTAYSLLDDESVQIFLTGNTPIGSRSSGAGGEHGDEMEMSDLHLDRQQDRLPTNQNRKRPDLRKIVDEVFKHGMEERVAVLVCGPERLARELRQHVGAWVNKGRSVWWHNESFGF